jgi:TolB protein
MTDMKDKFLTFGARRRGLRKLAGLVACGMLLIACAGVVWGQNFGRSDGEDPAEDIIIEGIGFAKLMLQFEADNTLAGFERFPRLRLLFEKNLCWSGLFHLVEGKTKYCRPRGKPARIDMRFELGERNGRLQIRLIDNGPENLVLYEDQLGLEQRVSESVVMELINRLTERITGQPGLLGSAIAFVLRQPGYAKVIVATSTHGTHLKLISHNSDINLLPKWAPSGLSIVYTVLGNGGTNVYFHDLTTNGAGPGDSHYVTTHGTLNTGGSFSPDGKNLVLTMSFNQSADLYALELRTRKFRQLTSRSGIETQAHWAPDGSKIVFVSDRTGTPQVYLLDLETNEDLRLTFNGTYNADPKWSADGQSILFTRRVNRRDQIHIMDQYGENLRAVTRGRFDAEQAEWAPDGRQIVFTSNRTGDFKLYVVSADGTNLRRLTRTPPGFEETSPSWTLRKLAH